MWRKPETIEEDTSTTEETITTFAKALFEGSNANSGTVYTASVSVSENTTPAIHEATAGLLKSLLERHTLHATDIICALFTSHLNAEYPARAARELLGWQSVPLLCAQEIGAPEQPPGSISSILLVNAADPARADLAPLRGLRGAALLRDDISEEDTNEHLQRELRWLFSEILTRNRLSRDAVLRTIVTVTPDLSLHTARAAAGEVLGASIPLLVAQEIDVAGAPERCLRVLLIARTAQPPQPVYSEPARRLLRPDLPPYVPPTIRILPSEPLQGEISVPASKYYTLRAILAAFLAEGTSTIESPAQSDDTTVLLKACAQLGATINTRYQDGHCTLSIQGVGGQIRPDGPVTIDAGNAGAVLRLLLGICAASPEAITFTTSHPQSLGRRPNDDLLHALAQLGAQIIQRGPAGTLPITLRGNQIHGGLVRLSGKKSSQFLSALLYLAPLLPEDTEIEIIDTLASASFVDLTIHMLQQAGITILTQERARRYLVPGGQRYQSRTVRIPGDYPSAAALLAAVAVAKGEISLYPLAADDPDGQALLDAFTQMGVEISRQGERVTARAEGPLQGIQLDGSAVIDSVPCLAAAACFASTPSRIYNIANLRLKESDRIYELAQELGKMGCQIIPSSDALDIQPVQAIAGGVEVDAHADHRLAQALAVAGLGSTQAITLRNAHQVSKSYPHFFDDLASLGASIQTSEDEEVCSSESF